MHRQMNKSWTLEVMVQGIQKLVEAIFTQKSGGGDIHSKIWNATTHYCRVALI